MALRLLSGQGGRRRVGEPGVFCSECVEAWVVRDVRPGSEDIAGVSRPAACRTSIGLPQQYAQQYLVSRAWLVGAYILYGSWDSEQ